MSEEKKFVQDGEKIIERIRRINSSRWDVVISKLKDELNGKVVVDKGFLKSLFKECEEMTKNKIVNLKQFTKKEQHDILIGNSFMMIHYVQSKLLDKE